jgi:hypothetical protein
LFAPQEEQNMEGGFYHRLLDPANDRILDDGIAAIGSAAISSAAAF